MTHLKFLLAFFIFITGIQKIQACPGTPGSVEKIVCLADSLKSTLTSSQISTLQLVYSYANSQSWSNLPTTFQARIGLKIGTLNASQLAIAKLLIKEVTESGIANEGYDEVSQLLLADAYLSANGGGADYGGGLYYLCFNGTPSLTGTFSIKFGGHHLQVENTYNKGVMVGATPHFEAVEPLTFTTNGTTYNPITQEKNALAAMFAALGKTELASAKLSTTFTDVLMGAKNGGTAKDWIFPATKLGLKVSTLTATQKQLVLDAIKTYVMDIDKAHADKIMTQYTTELNETYIAYSGTSALNTKNDYVRIDGPGVWIEFTVQGGIIMSGVHYHSIWRDHIRDYGGAGSTSGIKTTEIGTIVTAIDDKKAELIKNVITYPNPASENATVQFSLNTEADIRINIYDLKGRLVLKSDRGKLSAGTNSVLIHLGDLPSGIYNCIIEAGAGRYISRVIKE